METFRSVNVPENLISLYEAPDEAVVIQRAQELIQTCIPLEQEGLLNDPFFLGIVNQALLGMDEHRKDALLDLLKKFSVPLRAEAFSRFSSLLEQTLPQFSG